VVHLTGHGASDARVLLEDEFGEGQLVGAQELTQLFGARIPRVVVLSLCYSARAAATALRDAGIGAVVAIEADQPIADKAAIIFNQQFYAMLARGAPVGAAFERAQTRVVHDAQVGDAHPPLDGDGKSEAPWSQRFTLIGDGNIAFAVGAFDKTPSQPEPRVIGNLRARNANFVGRAKEIVEIVKTFDGRGVLSNAPTPRVAIIGAGGIGKTELSKAVAWWYVERGKADAVLWASVSRDQGEFILRDLASLLSIVARGFVPLIVNVVLFWRL
jgi:hypothetical protein